LISINFFGFEIDLPSLELLCRQNCESSGDQLTFTPPTPIVAVSLNKLPFRLSLPVPGMSGRNNEQLERFLEDGEATKTPPNHSNSSN